MNQKVKEPFLYTQIFNLILGITILGLLFAVLIKKEGTEIFEVLLFALAAVENFIGATVSFSEKKRVRGNIYAIVCGVFLVAALILAVRYFV